jgi:hypothetical protein
VTWHWQKIKNKAYQRQEKIELHRKKDTLIAILRLVNDRHDDSK